MTFYLKYRPQKLEELDISEVRESLKKVVNSGKIPHAFLFSGPKGTGKTSAARILAKILNCDSPSPRLRKDKEPCNKCDQCISITKGSNIDVIELDAASHRGIDDVRLLTDAVKLAPASARKKVYIIDEAHMLTTEASNALLKTLEEPPSHVAIILATTNPEKLIPTIRSRATNIVFGKAGIEEMVSSLTRIVKGEKIKVEKEALSLIAQASEGSFRDAAKILEQISTEKKNPDAKFVEEFLYKKKSFSAEEFIEVLSQRDTKKALEIISLVTRNGGSIERLLETLLTQFRKGLLGKVGVNEDTLTKFSKEELIYLIELFIKAQKDLKDATIEELPVEIAVIRWGERESGGTGLANSRSRSHEAPALDSASQGLAQTIISGTRGQSRTPLSKTIDDEIWRKILELVRPINASIEALLRAARPVGYDGKTLTLGVFYRFHKERLEDGHHRRILEEVIASVLGTPARVICVLTEPPVKKVIEEVKKEEPVLTEGEDKDIIKVAEEIFGN